MDISDISNIDKNFANQYDVGGMRAYDINEAPFRIYGACREAGETDFKRLDHSFAAALGNTSVSGLYKNTSGIRLRFKTDSARVILSCTMPNRKDIPHMPFTGSGCFDLYADGTYCNVFRPGIDVNGGYSESSVYSGGYTSGYNFKSNKMREILIHFPLYNDVSGVLIMLEEGAQIREPDEYRFPLPIVFYGSSITQGGCASHAGNCYPAILSRRLGFDFINLGFSAGCLAERGMAEYICNLKKSVLVYDYDHNAPNADFLRSTHEPFFKEIRKREPSLPVVMISAADGWNTERKIADRKERREVIYRTYKNAIEAGDKNVYFIDGETIYREVGGDYCTVDSIHPNDLGFWCMANAIEKIIEKILIG